MEVSTGDGEPNLPVYQPPSNGYGNQIPRPQFTYGQAPWQQQFNAVSQSGQKERPMIPFSYVEPYPAQQKPNISGLYPVSGQYSAVSYYGQNSYQPIAPQSSFSYGYGSSNGNQIYSQGSSASSYGQNPGTPSAFSYGQTGGSPIQPYRPQGQSSFVQNQILYGSNQVVSSNNYGQAEKYPQSFDENVPTLTKPPLVQHEDSEQKPESYDFLPPFIGQSPSYSQGGFNQQSPPNAQFQYNQNFGPLADIPNSSESKPPSSENSVIPQSESIPNPPSQIPTSNHPASFSDSPKPSNLYSQNSESAWQGPYASSLLPPYSSQQPQKPIQDSTAPWQSTGHNQGAEPDSYNYAYRPPSSSQNYGKPAVQNTNYGQPLVQNTNYRQPSLQNSNYGQKPVGPYQPSQQSFYGMKPSSRPSDDEHKPPLIQSEDAPAYSQIPQNRPISQDSNVIYGQRPSTSALQSDFYQNYYNTPPAQRPSSSQIYGQGQPSSLASFIYGTGASQAAHFSQQPKPTHDSPNYSQPPLVTGQPFAPGPLVEPVGGPLADELPDSQQVPPLLLEQGSQNQAANGIPLDLNSVGSNQCNQVVKVPSDRTEVVEVSIPAGKCSLHVEAPKGRLALQLKGLMLPCNDQTVSVFEGSSHLPLTSLCGQVAETPLYLMDATSARMEINSRGVKFTVTAFLW